MIHIDLFDFASHMQARDPDELKLMSLKLSGALIEELIDHLDCSVERLSLDVVVG